MQRYGSWAAVMLVGALALTSCGDDDEDVIPRPEPTCPQPGSATPSNDPDTDGDGVIDRCDVCPELADPDQLDSDSDGLGDACDPDDDNDGTADDGDTCPTVLQVTQADGDGDGLGDACDPCPALEDRADSDSDGLNDCEDLCPGLNNADNTDTDGDGVGDACDVCPMHPDAGQTDTDGDGLGDACDPDPGFTLEEATIASVHAALLRGDLTCAGLVDAYLDRIQRFDLDLSDGPPINAFVAFNAQAREQARALDRAQADGGLVGPLHCVPIVVKDLYATGDMPVSSGTLAFVGLQPRQPGFAVARLRERGAIVIATTAMDEMSRGIFGIGGRHGRTGNAYNANYNPGGSSSGSGAAVGANFALGSTGTDNCASLTIPASYNGLVSMRSSVGLVSMSGVFPSGRMDAVPGPLARSVEDLTLLLDAMAGEDPADPRTLTYEGERPATYTAALNADGLQGKRIGILRKLGSAATGNAEFTYYDANPEALRIFRRAVEDMERLGATVIDNLQLPDLDTRRTGYGFAEDFDVFIQDAAGPIQSYEDACDTGRFSAHVYSGGPEQCRQAIASDRANSRVGSDGHKIAIERYEANRQRIEALLDKHNLDALLYPTDGIGAAGVTYSRANCTASSVSQTPTLVIQVGNTASGLPVGMTLHGRKWDEARLLELGYAWEQGTRHRRPPRLHAALPADAPVAPLDPAEATALRLRIGQSAFDAYLGTGGKFDLNASNFTPLVEAILRDEGLDWLVDP